LIRCEQSTKSFHLAKRNVHALQGVSFAITEPGFYAIMGASGSGKSTLLHLLAGIDTPDAGTITVGNTALEHLSDKQLTQFRREGVGIVFQQFNLIATMNAIDNVCLPGLIAGEPLKPLKQRATQLLARLGLEGRESHRPEALSGGEQQRVAIARALIFQPPVLLADEPTGNLDSASSDKLWTLLAEIAQEQETTVVMVTHEPAAAAHCKRVFMMRDGRIAHTIEAEHLDASSMAAEYQRVRGA